ncbi:MAG: hypothetical protein L0287_35550, partial [Anaerolineae bacterium]|nr:hypothetical protein [Anaerolineae bacterium]
EKIEYLDENRWFRYHLRLHKWSAPKEITWRKYQHSHTSTSAWNEKHDLHDFNGWEHAFAPGVIGDDDEFTVVPNKGEASPSQKTAISKTLDMATREVAALESPPKITEVSEPAWLGEMESMDEFRDWLINRGKVIGVPSRVESIPKTGQFYTIFNMLWPEDVPARFNIFKTWQRRCKMRFSTLSEAYIWRNKKLVTLMLTEESEVGWSEKVIVMTCNGIDQVKELPPEKNDHPIYLRTYNRRQFTPAHWQDLLMKTHNCSRCQTVVKSVDIQFTTVQKSHDKTILVCAACNLDTYLAASPEMQQSIKEQSGVDISTWTEL